MNDSAATGIDSNETPTSRLAGQYHLLFTLPSTTKAVSQALLIAAPIFIIMHYFINTTLNADVSLLYLTLRTVISVITLIGTIVVEQTIFRRNPLASFRRLSATSIFPNGAWLITTVIGSALFLFYPSLNDLLSLTIIGMFFAVSIRLLIFRSIFLDSTLKSISLAFFQPLLISLTIISPQFILWLFPLKPIPS